MRWLLVGVTLAAVLLGPRRADAQTKSYAVVKTSATLRVAPKASARGYALGLDARDGDGFDVEILGTRGDFYKVRNLRARRCYDTISDISSFEMTFYVAKTELQPVLTEQVSIDLGDGQRLEALPGVLSSEGKLRIVGVSTQVPLPAEAIGTIYKAAGDPFSPVATNGRLRAGFWSMGEVSVKAAFAVPARIEDVSGGRLATLERPCIRLQLRVKKDEADLGPRSAHLGGFLGSLGAFTVPKGTALFWPNGKSAGTVRSDTTIAAEQGGLGTGIGKKGKKGKKGKTCFERSLGVGKIKLCARTKSLKEIPTIGIGFGNIGGLGTGSSSKVSLGRVRTTSGLDKNIVRRYLRRRVRAISRCHVMHRGSHRSFRSGRMDVRLVIDKRGRIGSTKLRRNSTGSKKLGTCVLGVIGSIRFPRPRNNLEVKAQLSLTFRSR